MSFDASAISHALITAAPMISVAAFVIALLSVLLLLSIDRRVRRLVVRNGDSLEDTMAELTRRVRELGEFREELEAYLQRAEGRLRTSARGIGLVRFNPFEGDGSGGNQSFAAALLDENHNGIVLSAIYARHGTTSVYAKPIQKGVSSFELTEEEKGAIAKAIEYMKSGTALASKK